MNVLRKYVILLAEKVLPASKERDIFIEYLMSIPDAATWPDWYDVRDKLPDDMAHVLFVYGNGWMRMGVYHDNKFDEGDGERVAFARGPVTHWLPLPPKTRRQQ